MSSLEDQSRSEASQTGRVLRARTADHLTDADLVERALAQDAWAREALFRRHVRPVTATVIRLLGRRQEAEDVVQDTFATAFAELGTLRDPGALRAWLMQIAVRKMHRLFRRRKLLRVLGLDRGYDDAALSLLADPSSAEEARAELALIDEFLSKQPAELRIAWMLRAVEGEAIEDVARICRCSPATAKRRIKAVQDRLDEHLEEGSR
jgi:RNA polymerase sigma-70 factor (ECF subfamily)